MLMKKILAALALTVALGASCQALASEDNAAPSGAYSTQNGSFKWYTNFEQAKKAAAKENKPIFVLFTGSDWCPYCVKLENEILKTSQFRKWARSKAILFIADAKGGAKNLSAEHRKLMMQFGGGGFPSIFITDPEGKAFGRTGYLKKKPAEYIQNLDAILASKK